MKLVLETPYRGGCSISSQGGRTSKKLRRAEGGAKIFGVFRVKNHDFTPKNHIFSDCGGRRENCWGISCEKSRFYAKRSYFFQFQGGGGAPGAHPPPCPTYSRLPLKSYFQSSHALGAFLRRQLAAKKSLKIPKGGNKNS